jgi:superfamily II DNA or RNA helicase
MTSLSLDSGTASGLPPHTRFAHEDLVRVFDVRTLKRGRTLVLSGAVTLITLDGRTIEAAVSENSQTYRTTLTPSAFGHRVVFGRSCNCKRSECPHVAATALAVLDQSPKWRRPVQQSFLESLVAPAPRPDRHRILYDLEPGAGDCAIFIGVVVETAGADTYRVDKASPGQVIAMDGADNGDRALCRLLGGSNLERVGIPANQPAIVELVLKRLLTSGRCRWQPTKKPVVAGPSRRVVGRRNPRSEAITWAMQQAAILQAGGRAWYVDAATGELGIAELHIIEPLESSPVVRAPRSPAALNRGVKQPQPAAAPVIVEGTPIPMLSLTRVAMPGSGLATQMTDAMRLCFLYDRVPVDPDDERQFVKVERGPEDIVFLRRDRTLEAAALGLLRDAGFAMIRLVSKGDDKGTRLHTLRGQDIQERWQSFISNQIPTLEDEGWQVEIGEDFGPELIEATGDWDLDVTDTGDGWFSLEMGIDIDGTRHPLLPILTKLLDQGGLAKARIVEGKVHASLGDGRLIALPVDRVAKLLATIEEMIEAAKMTAAGKMLLPIAEAAEIIDIEDIITARWHHAETIRAYALKLRAGGPIERVDLPASFRGSLRPYQHEGLDWLQHLREHQVAGILADDMGLGKTAQTLAHIVVEHAAGRLTAPALIVVPTSLVANWLSESVKFAPHLKTLVLHGLERHARLPAVAKADIVLTTYSVLARDIAVMKTLDWHLVVLDEAQAIKNPDAQVTRAVCDLEARHRLCLSGTPIENNLSEIWSQFAFLMPGFLGSRKIFNARFRMPIEKRGDIKRNDQLARRLRPFMLRRTKAEVANDLPPKTEIVRRVDFDSDQRDLYETIRLSMHDKIRGEIAARSLARSSVVVLDALLKLRQACCDPRLVKSVTAAQGTGSGKLACLMEMLSEMVSEGRRILVFSQFTSMLALIKPELVRAGIGYVELTGSTIDRAQPVQSFQSGEVSVFLISLKAGGKGLNLTAADTVIHYDPWWNPAVERQATDRAHRIGQDKPVFVYKLIATGTVEERILDLQKRKGELADATLDGAQIGHSLDTEDIDYLFAPIEDSVEEKSIVAAS